MLAFLLSTLESNEDKEIFTKIYEQYRPFNGTHCYTYSEGAE